MQILIVDDHAVVRKGLSLIILDEYPNADIQEVFDVDSLMSVMQKSDFDLIICDINLPGRSGLEGLRLAKELKPQTPVLIMSMNSEDQFALRAIKLGAAGYLNKDKVHEEILPAIATVLQGKKFITISLTEKMITELESDKNKLPHEYLSNREFEVFKMIASGNAVKDIASSLLVSPTTISTFRTRILEKTGMKTNAEIVKYALEHNII